MSRPHRSSPPRLLLLTALSLVAAAGPALAERQWHDRLFDKEWRLEARKDEVLVVFAAASTAALRQSIATAEGLSEAHPYSIDCHTAVYRVRPGDQAEAVALRMPQRPGVVAAAPAVVDREGYTKYYLPTELTVQFDRALGDGACRDRIARAGSSVVEDYWTPGYYRITNPAGDDVFAAIRAWYDDTSVVFAEPAYMCYDDALHAPNDPFFPQQWSERNTQQQGNYRAGADVEAVPAWDIEKGNPNVIIAIIDTGMDLTHEDLAANLLPRNGEDWDFANGDGSPDDDGDHGTACSGIAAAVQDNGIGVSGMAPGCRLMPLKINLSTGMNANRADAINYAASRRAEFQGLVMSCSWRMSSGDFTAVEAAVQNGAALDCVMCFASGNDNGPVSYPAKYPQTICVGATSPCDERKSPASCDGENFWGSNFGPEMDVCAPGVKIYTTDRSGSAGYSGNNYFSTFNGTSSATPLAAGVCALIWSADGSLTNEGVRQILQSSAEDEVGTPSEDVPGWDQYMGFGRINAFRALELAAIEESFEDDMESGATEWTHAAATPTFSDAWHLSTEQNHTEGGTVSYKCGSEVEGAPYGTRINAALVSPTVKVPEQGRLQFWHWMDAALLEGGTAGDGGVVEISTNGGTSWVRLTPLGGYPNTWGSNTLSPFTLGSPVYSGQFDWTPAFVDLSAYVGVNVRIRFRFGSRDLLPPEQTAQGWFVDDVNIGPPGPASVSDGLTRGLPLSFEALEPNPSTGVTSLRFRLAGSSDVRWQVVDVSGRVLAARAEGLLGVGDHVVTWDGTDALGHRVPAGVYYARVLAGERSVSRRLVRVE